MHVTLDSAFQADIDSDTYEKVFQDDIELSRFFNINKRVVGITITPLSGNPAYSDDVNLHNKILECFQKLVIKLEDGAYCLDMPKFHYLLNVIKTWIIIPVLLAVIGYIHKVLPCDSWLTFVCSAGVSGIVGYLIMLVIYQRERVLQVLHRGKGKC